MLVSANLVSQLAPGIPISPSHTLREASIPSKILDRFWGCELKPLCFQEQVFYMLKQPVSL